MIELDQAHIGASFGGELGGEEFLERVGLGHRPEHIGEPVAEGVSAWLSVRNPLPTEPHPARG